MGGGAAVGSDGPDGAAPVVNVYWDGRGGRGGDGADAQPVFPQTPLSYGSGGSGGHGGGAGGSAHSAASYEGGASYVIDGEPGSGGSGSAGQNGANGCILVYYKKPDAYQYRFSIQNGNLILSYSTETPPPFSRSGDYLIYSYPEGETPPDFEIRNGQLYLIKGDD